MITLAPRYVVSTVTTTAGQSRGGRYRKPVIIRVLDTTASEWHAVRRLTPGVMGEWGNVDSRYDGPRSAHGNALAHAAKLADELNAKHWAASVMVGL